MAVYPTAGGSEGTWGAETRAFHGVTKDLATGKILLLAEKASAMTGAEGDRVVTDKGYVDSQSSGSGGTLNDSDSQALDSGHAYLAQTAGFVTAWAIDTAGSVAGYVGATDNPAGTGLQVGFNSSEGAASDPFISFFVASGKYFEVVKSTNSGPITWTPFVTGGGSPIDQD